MALHPTSLRQQAASHRDLASALLVVAVIVLTLALTAIFGVQQPGPSLEFVPDPAGLGLPF